MSAGTLPLLLSHRLQGQQLERDVKLLAQHVLRVTAIAQPSKILLTLPCPTLQTRILSQMTSCWPS